MRLLLFAAAAAFAIPAAAAPPRHEPPEDQWADSLPDQAEIDAATGVADRAADAIMDVKVGPLLDAIDSHATGPRHGDETIGDMARRDDPDFDRKMHDSVGRMGSQMSAIMARIAVLGPELQRSMKEMERNIEQATHDLPEADEY